MNLLIGVVHHSIREGTGPAEHFDYTTKPRQDYRGFDGFISYRDYFTNEPFSASQVNSVSETITTVAPVVISVPSVSTMIISRYPSASDQVAVGLKTPLRPSGTAPLSRISPAAPRCANVDGVVPGVPAKFHTSVYRLVSEDSICCASTITAGVI